MLEKQISSALGFNNYKEVKEHLDLEITLNTRHYHGSIIEVSYVDPFYKSYGQRSDISINDRIATDTANQDKIDKIKRIVSAKKKQARLIASIKLYAYEEIKKFISESFDIPLEHIEESDIKFKDWSCFWIADQHFGFSGTLVRKEFIIYDNVHGSHKANYTMVVAIKNYFNKKYDL